MGFSREARGIARLLLIAALASGCGGPDLETFVNCMNKIYRRCVTAECASRATRICNELSDEPSFVWKARRSWGTVKGITEALFDLAGVEWDLSGYDDCVLHLEDFCRRQGQNFPDLYEGCTADITDICTEQHHESAC